MPPFRRRTSGTTRPVIQIACIAVFLLLAGSCGGRNIGYGVVLWSSDGDSGNGRIVTVNGKSDLGKSYTVIFSDSENAKNEPVVIPQWRLQFFEEKEQAETFAEAFATFRTAYARSNRNALPIRRSPEVSAPIVYRLREQEVIKVVERTTENEILLNGLRGYWYRVITDTGTTGFTFSDQLTVFDASMVATTDETGGAPADPRLEMFLSKTWRPDYYQEMIDRKNFDLVLFTPRYGIFPDRENQLFTVVTPSFTADFPYRSITRLGGDRYILDGSRFQFTITDRFTSVQYNVGGQEYSAAYVSIETDIEEIISKEIARRRAIFEKFLEQGTVLSSSAYGSITLSPDQTFLWNGYQRLSPNVIPPKAGQEGFVEFRLALSRELARSYEGVVSFQFEEMGRNTFISFMFSFSQNGVRMVFVPERSIRNHTVSEEPATPIIIFFSFSA